MSNIEHRLEQIEEHRFEEISEFNEDDQVNTDLDDTEKMAQISSESGIEDGDANDSDIVDESENEIEKLSGELNVVVEIRNVGDNDNKGRIEPYPSMVSGFDTEAECEATTVFTSETKEYKEEDGIQALDIIAHEKSTPLADTMLKLLQAYPNSCRNRVQMWENNDFETADELTLGVPRTVRHAKMKSAKKRLGSSLLADTKVVGSPVALSCRYCKCAIMSGLQKNNYICLPGDWKVGHPVQSLSARKPKDKQRSHAAVNCDCRLDPVLNGGKRQGLKITGNHVSLCDRELDFS